MKKKIQKYRKKETWRTCLKFVGKYVEEKSDFGHIGEYSNLRSRKNKRQQEFTV